MEGYDGTCCQIVVQVTLAKAVLDDLIQIARAGYVFDSGGYGLAALLVAGALGLSFRFQQRDVGVPRRPGGPPYLGCWLSN